MASILKFHMVRHGPVFNPDQIWYGRDIPFDVTSPAIVAHFNHLAKILPSDPETSMWLSSDYPRAQALAEATLKSIPRSDIPELVLDQKFIEQQYGVMEGMAGLAAKKDPRLAEYFADMWGAPPQGGESMQMLQNRVGGRLDELSHITQDKVSDIVVFAHGGVNMAAFAHATGQSMIDIFKSRKNSLAPSFSYASRLELHFDRDRGKWLEAFEYDTGLPKHFTPT